MGYLEAGYVDDGKSQPAEVIGSGTSEVSVSKWSLSVLWGGGQWPRKGITEMVHLVPQSSMSLAHRSLPK